MKKIRIFLLILSICILFIILARKPLHKNEQVEVVTIRYEIGEGTPAYQYETVSLSSEKEATLEQFLGKKAWFINSGWSDLLFSQNYIPQGAGLLTLYFGDSMISVSGNGVVRDVSMDQYAYFSLWRSNEKGSELYQEILELLEK